MYHTPTRGMDEPGTGGRVGDIIFFIAITSNDEVCCNRDGESTFVVRGVWEDCVDVYTPNIPDNTTFHIHLIAYRTNTARMLTLSMHPEDQMYEVDLTEMLSNTRDKHRKWVSSEARAASVYLGPRKDGVTFQSHPNCLPAVTESKPERYTASFCIPIVKGPHVLRIQTKGVDHGEMMTVLYKIVVDESGTIVEWEEVKKPEDLE